MCEKTDPLYNATYDQSYIQPNIQTVTYSGTAPSVTPIPVDTIPTERDENAVIDEDGDYYKGVEDVTPTGNYWTSTQDGVGRQVLISATGSTAYLAAAEAKNHVKNNSGRFLLFSAAGADSEFKTTSDKAITAAGRLKFDFAIPLTYSDNGAFTYGNSPTTICVGDGTKKAIEITIWPNLVKSYVRNATLSVNGTNVCAYETGAQAQDWSGVECIFDNENKRATVSIKKANGQIYSAQVDYLDSDCGGLNTFGVKASAGYGTILLDRIKMYQTATVESPSMTPNAAYSPVVVVPTVSGREHFYQVDLSELNPATVTKMIPVTGSISEANSYSTGDFGTDTLKLAHINALDGWGYIHKAYDTSNNGRQTGASISPEGNAVTLNGTGTVAGGVLSFIPKNVDGLEMPVTGTITYRFTAVISGTDGKNKDGTAIPVEAEYGFTTADNGTALNAVGNFSLYRTDGVEVVMTYNVETKAYSVTVGDEVKASGTASAPITGIYTKSYKNTYTYSTFKNLVVDTDSYTPPPAPTPIPTTTSTLYTENVRGITSGQITNKIKTTETMEELNLYCVSDFKDGNSRTTPIPALDGWGYVHCAYDNSSTQQRQSSAEANVSNNTVTIVSTSNVAGGAITFIPQNVDDLEIPEVGKITYSFKAVVSGGDITYGFTSSSDGAVVSSVASTVISSATKNVVMTYDKYTNFYSITVDGELKASGTADRITGIYAGSSKSWATGSIKDLVVTFESYDITTDPVPDPTPTPTPAPTPIADSAGVIDFTNRTLTVTATGNKTRFVVEDAASSTGNLNAVGLAAANAGNVLKLGSTENGGDRYLGYTAPLKVNNDSVIEYSGIVNLSFKLEPIQVRGDNDARVVVQFSDVTKENGYFPLSVCAGNAKNIQVNGDSVNVDYGQ